MPDKLATHVGIKSEFDKRGTGLVQIIVAICFGWKVWGYGRGVDSICVCVLVPSGSLASHETQICAASEAHILALWRLPCPTQIICSMLGRVSAPQKSAL